MLMHGDAYNNFALVYDFFMRDIPYDNWVKYIYEIWGKYNYKPKLIGELGCGTGNITLPLAMDGFDMIGIDYSADMLMQAKQKADELNLDILFLNQNMTDFELYGTVDCFISLFDSVNYILNFNDLVKTFKLVNNYLNPTGLFIFDINTEFKFEKILADNTFSEVSENTAYIWENYYDSIKRVNEYYINFFVKEHNTDKYIRFNEVHYQKAYNLDEIISAAEESGLLLIDIFDAFTFNSADANSERVYFILRKE